MSSSQLTQDRKDAEGRNFILRKLCELGLGEVTFLSFCLVQYDEWMIFNIYSKELDILNDLLLC